MIFFCLFTVVTINTSSNCLAGHQWNMPVESNFLGSSLLGVADFSAAMDHGAGGTSLFSRSMVAIKALLAIVGLKVKKPHMYR